MSDHSAIEWTDATWNPVTGCTEVSTGCDHCYARTLAERFRGVPGHHFEHGFDLTLRPDRLGLPLRWRASKRVFVNSMSDLWHETVPDEFIAAVWVRMLWTSPAMAGYRRPGAPCHTYQVLTKRPGRMRSWLRGWGNREQRTAWISAAAERGWCHPHDWVAAPYWPAVLPNVWLGVSVEDQRWADIRVPILLDTPAAVRFLSCEPLLGPIDLYRAVVPMGSQRGHGLTASFVHWGGCCDTFHGIDWVIVGGESGRGARPMHPDWARSLRDQCLAATGVRFLFKQWGRWRPVDTTAQMPSGIACPVFDRDGQFIDLNAPPDGWPGWQAARERGWQMFHAAGKHAAGRVLDGRTWDEFPGQTRGGSGQ
jgi:protein gp37